MYYIARFPESFAPVFDSTRCARRSGEHGLVLFDNKTDEYPGRVATLFSRFAICGKTVAYDLTGKKHTPETRISKNKIIFANFRLIDGNVFGGRQNAGVSDRGKKKDANFDSPPAFSPPPGRSGRLIATAIIRYHNGGGGGGRSARCYRGVCVCVCVWGDLGKGGRVRWRVGAVLGVRARAFGFYLLRASF